MSLQIASPFQQFFDRDGSPLDNGFVYVGTVNLNPETNPLTVYFDDALTIPAAQPLRTSNGYIVRNGSPARIYTSQEDFSLTVREKNNVLVFTVADATSLSNLAVQFAQFVSDLADGTGSSLVGYNQGGVDAVDRTVQSRLRDFISAKDFGAVGDGIADDTAELQAFLNACEGGSGFIPEGKYRVNGSLTLPSNAVITGVPGNDAGTLGTVILQYGNVLFAQTEGLLQLHLSNLTFDMQYATPTARTVCFGLKSHMRCVFSGFRFVNYDVATIMERWPLAATSNTIDNVYSDWQVSACENLDIAIGQEGYYFVHDGDGITTVINTNIAWPEQNIGSVVVLRENTDRSWTELTPVTDYAVSYPSGNLTVTLTAAATSGQRIHIWPSQPRTDGNRRPISNNLWENIRVDYLYGRGHASIRWVDAETYRFERLNIAANSGRAYLSNPYQGRTGQGGDYGAFEDSIVTYRSELGLTVPTLRGFDFGPGCQSMSGRGIRMDRPWLDSGVSYALEYRDRRRVALTGTVSGTSGSPTVTGVGTLFTQQLTLIGSAADFFEVGGDLYAIASIDSDTQVTLSTNLTTSPSGAAAHRVNVLNGVDALMTFASMGDGFYVNRSWQSGSVTINSLTERSGSATILSGATSVTITHGLRRAPLPGELFITSHSAMGGRSMSVGAITDTAFVVNISSAAGADYTIGWHARLMELN